MTRRIERRAFLMAAVSSLAAFAPLAQIGCTDTDTSLSRRSGAPEGYFAEGGLESARAIGRRWLAIVAPGATEAEIRSLVAPTIARIEGAASDDDAIAVLNRRVTDDFAGGSTANVDGWTFATTELHVCVIAGLGG